MTIRVIAGEISAKDATTRTVLPTTTEEAWPPLERVAETIASSTRRFPVHRHANVEVVTYVIEGSGLYSFGTNPAERIGAGSIHVLAAHSSVAHAINPGKGQTLRWFAVVAGLPPSAGQADTLQSGRTGNETVKADGTITRSILGPGGPARSEVGLIAHDIEFAQEGTTFRRVGHSLNALAYAVSGAGSVDGRPIELGEAALVEGSAGIAIQGRPGFRVVLLQVPRPAQSVVSG